MLAKMKRLLEFPFRSVILFVLNVPLKIKLGCMLDHCKNIRCIVTCRALIRACNYFTLEIMTSIELRLVRSHLKQNVPCILGDFVGITTPKTQSVAEKKIQQLVIRGETTRMSIMNISISFVIHKLHFTHFKFITIVQANKMVESVVVFCTTKFKE
jgi:hypothetical protein